MSARTPYATATVTPSGAVRPAIQNDTAATPSRGPQPPTLIGRPIAMRASSRSGSSVHTEAVVPAA